jgi:hypothetical protein
MTIRLVFDCIYMEMTDILNLQSKRATPFLALEKNEACSEEDSKACFIAQRAIEQSLSWPSYFGMAMIGASALGKAIGSYAPIIAVSCAAVAFLSLKIGSYQVEEKKQAIEAPSTVLEKSTKHISSKSKTVSTPVPRTKIPDVMKDHPLAPEKALIEDSIDEKPCAIALSDSFIGKILSTDGIPYPNDYVQRMNRDIPERLEENKDFYYEAVKQLRPQINLERSLEELIVKNVTIENINQENLPLVKNWIDAVVAVSEENIEMKALKEKMDWRFFYDSISSKMSTLSRLRQLYAYVILCILPYLKEESYSYLLDPIKTWANISKKEESTFYQLFEDGYPDFEFDRWLEKWKEDFNSSALPEQIKIGLNQEAGARDTFLSLLQEINIFKINCFSLEQIERELNRYNGFNIAGELVHIKELENALPDKLKDDKYRNSLLEKVEQQIEKTKPAFDLKDESGKDLYIFFKERQKDLTSWTEKSKEEQAAAVHAMAVFISLDEMESLVDQISKGNKKKKAMVLSCCHQGVFADIQTSLFKKEEGLVQKDTTMPTFYVDVEGKISLTYDVPILDSTFLMDLLAATNNNQQCSFTPEEFDCIRNYIARRLDPRFQSEEFADDFKKISNCGTYEVSAQLDFEKGSLVTTYKKKEENPDFGQILSRGYFEWKENQNGAKS